MSETLRATWQQARGIYAENQPHLSRAGGLSAGHLHARHRPTATDARAGLSVGLAPAGASKMLQPTAASGTRIRPTEHIRRIRRYFPDTEPANMGAGEMSAGNTRHCSASVKRHSKAVPRLPKIATPSGKPTVCRRGLFYQSYVLLSDFGVTRLSIRSSANSMLL